MYASIVVGTDGSDTAERAVDRALDLADRAGEARVHLVAAYGGPQIRTESAGPGSRGERVDLREVAEGLLSRAAERVRQRDLEPGIHARQGHPADVLLDVAEEEAADLIVVGNKGISGARRFLLGSVPTKVAHHAHCDVLIAHTT